MEEQKYVHLTSVKNLVQAELLQSLLRANNIPCEIRDRGQAEIFEGAASTFTEGIILRVPEEMLDAANEVLQAARDAGKLLAEDEETDE